MTMSDYLRQVREKVGHDLLVLPSAAVALFDEQSRLLLGRHADLSTLFHAQALLAHEAKCRVTPNLL